MAQDRRRPGLIATCAVLVALLAGATSYDPVARRVSLMVRGNPVAGDATSQARGADLFAGFCAGCHGDSGRGDGPAAGGLSRPPPDFTALNRPDSVLAMAITFGQGTEMPDWDDVLTPAEVWDLVNHLQTLQSRGGGGWRPRPAAD